MSALRARLSVKLLAVCLPFTGQALTTPQRAAAADPGYLMVHFTDGSATGQRFDLAQSSRQTRASVAAAVRCGVVRGRLERSNSPLSPSDRQRRIHL
jgi:hypothetical protein